jgi:hypothetical protein
VIPPLRRFAAFFLFATFCTQCSFAQEPATSNPTDAPADPDNKHVRVVRFVIAPHQEINLPVLDKESFVICLRGDSVSRIPVKGSEEKWATGPGSAISNRSGVTYIMANTGETPAELLVIELKESYAIAHLRVPWTERDPENVDPAHFRTILDSSDARVLLLHLNGHEGTMESQFTDRLEIALGDLHFTDTDVEGKTEEVRRGAGSVRWEKLVMHSAVNLGEKPLDNLIVELKHPFCYEVPDTVSDSPDAKSVMKSYLDKVKDSIEKKWMKNMLRSVRDLEQKGLVLVQFRIEAEGTIPEDGLRFRTVFADDSLMEKSLQAVRDAGPFPAFPQDFQKPFIDLRFSFLYNLPAHPPGCR